MKVTAGRLRPPYRLTMKSASDPPKPSRGGIEPAAPASLFGFDKLTHVAKGAYLFREGDAPQGVYLLHSGEVDLHVEVPGRVRNRSAQPGDLLGVMAVISNRPHMTTALAVTDCEVGFIDSVTFGRLIDESPVVWFTVLRQLSQDVNASYDVYREAGTAARV